MAYVGLISETWEDPEAALNQLFTISQSEGREYLPSGAPRVYAMVPGITAATWEDIRAIDPQATPEEFQTYCQGIVKRLFPDYDFASAKPLTFIYCANDEVNAGYIAREDDDYIFVTAGLLRFVDNEDQLAAVLGHEFTHLLCDHKGGAYAKQAEELFADHTAIKQLAERDYDPNEMLRLFERLKILHDQNDQSIQGLVRDMLSEHGHLDNRISALRTSLTRDWVAQRPDFDSAQAEKSQIPSELLHALRPLKYSDAFEVAVTNFSRLSTYEKAASLEGLWEVADNRTRREKVYQLVESYTREHHQWGTPESAREFKNFLDLHIADGEFRKGVNYLNALETIRKSSGNEFTTYVPFEPLQLALCELANPDSQITADAAARMVLEELRGFTEEAKPYRKFPILDSDVCRFVTYPFLKERDRHFVRDEPQTFAHLHEAVVQSEALQDVALIYNLVKDPVILHRIPEQKLHEFLNTQSLAGVATVYEMQSRIPADYDLGPFNQGSHRNVRQLFRERALENALKPPTATSADSEWTVWGSSISTVLADPSGVYSHGNQLLTLVASVLSDAGAASRSGEGSHWVNRLRNNEAFQDLNSFLLKQIDGYGENYLPSYPSYMSAVIEHGKHLFTPETLTALVGTDYWNRTIATEFRERGDSITFEKTRMAIGIPVPESLVAVFHRGEGSGKPETVTDWPAHWEAHRYLTQLEKNNGILNSGELNVLLYQLGEYESGTHVVNGARFDQKLAGAIERSSLWPAEAQAQVKLYKELQARKFLPLENPVVEQWTGSVYKNLSDLPPSSATSRLIAGMIAPPLPTHQWREDFCTLFAQKSAELLGMDDGSEAYLDAVKKFGQDMRYGPFYNHPGQHQAPFVRLSEAVNSQRDAAIYLEGSEDFSRRETLQQYQNSILAVQAVHTLLSLDNRIAPKVLNFLRQEYSEENTQELLDKIAPYQQGALRTLTSKGHVSGAAQIGKMLNVNSSDLRQLHADFWSAGIETRTLVVEALIDRGEANYDELLNEILTRSSLVTSATDASRGTATDTEHAEMLKVIVTEYFDIMPDYVRSKLIAGMLSVDKGDQGTQGISAGQALATMAVTLNDPALLKLCQAINSNPGFPKRLRDDVAFAKTDAAPLTRAQLWAAIDNDTGDLAERVEYLGPNLGNGSYYVVNEARILPPEEQVGNSSVMEQFEKTQALGLLRPNARENAAYGFSALETLADRLTQYEAFSPAALSAFQQAIVEARYMMEHETDTAYGMLQAQDAQAFYDPVAVQIDDKTYRFHTYRWNETGKNHKVMELIEGLPLNKFLADETVPFEQKRDIAQAIVLREICSMLSGSGFDYDRHSGNYIIGSDRTIYVIDTGAKELGELSLGDKAALGTFLADAVKATVTPGSTTNVGLVYKQYCEKYQEQGEQVPRVVIHAQKALLALGDYAPYLDAGSSFNMVNAIRHYQATSDMKEKRMIDETVSVHFLEQLAGQSSLASVGIGAFRTVVPKGVGHFRLVDH